LSLVDTLEEQADPDKDALAGVGNMCVVPAPCGRRPM